MHAPPRSLSPSLSSLSVSPRQSQLTEVKGIARFNLCPYRNSVILPWLRVRYIFMSTWQCFARRTCHGPPPFGRSKVSVLVYHRVDRVCRATRPAVPPAIENADNLIDLTVTIYDCPRFTGTLGKVNRLVERVSRTFIGLCILPQNRIHHVCYIRI